MRIFLTLRKKNAQMAVEYLLLLTTVVAIVLIGFKYYAPGFTKTSNIYFNRVSRGIMGNPSRCGNGCCGVTTGVWGIFGCNESVSFEDCTTCPQDCGVCPP